MTDSVMAQIVDHGMVPASASDTLNQAAAMQKMRVGAGEALADLLCTETIKQASSLKNYVDSLVSLDADGRKGFINYLSAVLKDRRALVKENGTSVFKEINKSASVRLSEFTTLAKSIDKGYAPEMTAGYHQIVAEAREHLRSLGEGDKRGRKATHGIVKAMKYLSKLDSLDDSDKAAIDALLAQAEAICKGMGLAADKSDEGDIPPF